MVETNEENIFPMLHFAVLCLDFQKYKNEKLNSISHYFVTTLVHFLFHF